MTDTAARVAGPVSLSAAAATIYTVPAATTLHILGYRVVNVTGSTAKLTMSIGADAIGKREHDQQAIPGHGILDYTGFIVVTAAEIIQAFADIANALTITISGVLVT